jgi:hypothetical protein
MKKTILILTSDPFSINYEIIKKSKNFKKKSYTTSICLLVIKKMSVIILKKITN